MSLFVRKIDRGKWPQAVLHQNTDPSADAITNCLKTKQNALSVWEVISETDIDEAVLAIVSGGDHLEAIDVVLMSSDYLKKQGIDCKQTKGLTSVDDLVEKHIDLSNLTYKKLGIIAYHIVDKIIDQKVKRYTERQLKEILNQAIGQNRLTPDRLKDSIRKKLQD
jgi:hypothetical protein